MLSNFLIATAIIVMHSTTSLAKDEVSCEAWSGPASPSWAAECGEECIPKLEVVDLNIQSGDPQFRVSNWNLGLFNIQWNKDSLRAFEGTKGQTRFRVLVDTKYKKARLFLTYSKDGKADSQIESEGAFYKNLDGKFEVSMRAQRRMQDVLSPNGFTDSIVCTITGN